VSGTLTIVRAADQGNRQLTVVAATSPEDRMPDLSHARIGQIAIVCQDVARATAFYRDVLGARFLFAAGPRLSFFDVGGTRLMLSPPEGEATGTPIFYFFVTDIESVSATLTDRGVAFVDAPHVIARMPDHELWLAEFRDSEGNILALMEERREVRA
jgi:methylmalonyl-CoA/ethylmalonyl-CoA epimerase